MQQVTAVARTECRLGVGRLASLALAMAILAFGVLAPALEAHGQPGAKKPAKPQPAKPKAGTLRETDVPYPPALPGGRSVVSDRSDAMLRPPASLHPDVSVAKTPPTVDFLFYPGQDYPGKPWSNWGDGLAVNGKYYSAIGDHLAISGKGDGTHGRGAAFVFEYDPESHGFRQLINTARLLDMPAGHYAPGKIHSRLDLGSDGWLYFATHRGSPNATTQEFHYQGDWILRAHPKTGQAEVVVQGPVPKHAIPTSVLDPERLIFYGGTAPAKGLDEEGIRFFAYDIKNGKLLYAGPDGPARYLLFARSTGRVYYVAGSADGELTRFDPATDKAPVKLEGSLIGVRAATEETADGLIYTVSLGQRSSDATIWCLDTKTERIRKVGDAAVGSQAYVASLDVDPSGRYLYYAPGAHGGSPQDGSPLVQFDVQTSRKKVIAFLDPFYTDKYGFTLKGTYSTAVDPAGDKVYVTWNVSRGTRAWDCCGLTVVHIPDSER
jgi:hypothetical protein